MKILKSCLLPTSIDLVQMSPYNQQTAPAKSRGIFCAVQTPLQQDTRPHRKQAGLCNLEILVSNHIRHIRCNGKVDHTFSSVNEVPGSGDGEEAAEDDRRVIHAHRGNW
jgi:hypothetical protein